MQAFPLNQPFRTITIITFVFPTEYIRVVQQLDESVISITKR